MLIVEDDERVFSRVVSLAVRDRERNISRTYRDVCLLFERSKWSNISIQVLRNGENSDFYHILRSNTFCS
jgi:hypothetical protein